MKLEDRVQTPELFFQEKGQKVLAVEPTQLLWAVLDPRLKYVLDALQTEQTIQETRHIPILDEEIETLYDAGLIKRNGTLSSQHDFPASNAEKQLALLVFHTSNACNFRCTYCYPDAAKGKSMPLAIAKDAINKAVAHHDKPVQLEFHGGEPLLHYSFIQSVVAYADQFRRENKGRKFSYSIQTNASLLDAEKVRFLAEHKFKIGVSIDGPALFNDQTRVYADGSGTYADIMQGIHTLQEARVPFGTIMVVSDINVVDHVYDFMRATKLKTIKLNPYFNQGRAVTLMPVQRRQQAYAYKTLDLVDRLVQHNATTGERLRLGNVSIMLGNILSPARDYMCMRSPCGAGTSMLGVDVDGSVYACEEMTGKKELILGNIQEQSIQELTQTPLVQLLRGRTPEDLPDCRTCEVRNVCEVSCANRSYNRTHNFYEKSELCAYYKIMFPELMWRVAENPEGMFTLL